MVGAVLLAVSVWCTGFQPTAAVYIANLLEQVLTALHRRFKDL